MILAAALLLQAAAPLPAATPLPCRWEEHVGDEVTVHLRPERRCARWTGPHRRTGVWIYGFEDSHFVEGAKTLDEAWPANRADANNAWLDFDEQSGIRPGCLPVMGQAYLVEFDGLDAVPKKDPSSLPSPFAGFGHMGMSRSAILIDHLRSMRLLGPLPGDQVRAAGLVPPCDADPPAARQLR